MTTLDVQLIVGRQEFCSDFKHSRGSDETIGIQLYSRLVNFLNDYRDVALIIDKTSYIVYFYVIVSHSNEDGLMSKLIRIIIDELYLFNVPRISLYG